MEEKESFKKMTKNEMDVIEKIVSKCFARDEDPLKGFKKIVVQDREHLNELIQYVNSCACDETYDYPLYEIMDIENNVIDLGVTLNLNFLDVSNITDMSSLLSDFCINPHCNIYAKIGFDFSEWDLSNVTNVYCMLEPWMRDMKEVDFGDLSKWNLPQTVDKSCMFGDPKHQISFQ